MDAIKTALDGDRLVRLAKELKEVERSLTQHQLFNGSTIEVSQALTRARYALIGIVNDSWSEAAIKKAEPEQENAAAARLNINTQAQMAQVAQAKQAIHQANLAAQAGAIYKQAVGTAQAATPVILGKTPGFTPLKRIP